MTVYFMNRELEFITLPDSIEELEEEIRLTGDNRDVGRYNNILVTLYRTGRIKELKRILRPTYSEKEITKGLKNIEKIVKEMEADTDTIYDIHEDTTKIKEKIMNIEYIEVPHEIEEAILKAMRSGEKKVFMDLLIDLNNADENYDIYGVLTKHWNRDKVDTVSYHSHN